MPELTGFTMPEAIETDQETSSPTYAKFIAEPWEKGFGHTLGNALRRILISSLEGVAVSSVRIDGVPHEFSTIPDVVEDVTDIILNIKKLRVRCDGDLPRTLELYADKKGDVTAAAVREDGVTTVLNPDAHICTLDRARPLRMEIEITQGRGYRPAELNKRDDQPIGVIPVDCLFSPVERVRYDIHSCRVGQRTDYDRLQLEVWTDGRITPEEALRDATEIMEGHLTVFTKAGGGEEVAPAEVPLSDEETELFDKMGSDVGDLELSVRAKNCLHNAGVEMIGELIQKSEPEMLKFRNFGKKSLEEIQEKLADMGLGLGMELPDNVVANFRDKQDKLKAEVAEGGAEDSEEESSAKKSKKGKKKKKTETEKE
ncbi:MAG: DNA-directed RNA polymerase subunit alpha [Lentisphaeria bacterium]